MPIEARRCRESGRTIDNPHTVFAVIDFALRQVAVIDEVTLKQIADCDRSWEGPFTPRDLEEWGYREEQLGANVHHTVPADQEGIVLLDDFMFAMWPNQVMRSLPNIATVFGYPDRDLAPRSNGNNPPH